MPVPLPAAKRVPKLAVLSIAPALAEAMRRIHNGESVSASSTPDETGEWTVPRTTITAPRGEYVGARQGRMS